jgi:putative ABC transport system permease protein
MNTVNGQADLHLTTANKRIADSALEAMEQQTSVRIASPVIDTTVIVPMPDAQSGLPTELRIIGIDIFKAASLTASLMPLPKNTSDSAASRSENSLFASSTIFLSDAALKKLSTAAGEEITVLVNGREQQLQVAGTVPGAASQTLGVMDIGSAQWLLDWPGQVSRIDLGIQSGSDLFALNTFVARQPDWLLVKPDRDVREMSNLSRAYRVNLNVLALVALFTGGFIVYASISLLTMRLSPMLALLNVLGASTRLPLVVIVGLGLLLGIAGALLGILLGIALAYGLLSIVGSDLGGGYFSSGSSSLQLSALPLIGFGSLGVAAAILGSVVPAQRLRSLSFANTLRTGQSVAARPARSVTGFAVVLVLIGLLLLLVPPIGGLPLAAYLAIACWLFAGIAFTGPLCAVLIRWASTNRQVIWARPPAWLASLRLGRSDGSTVAALSGVVASFALVCSMAIMVHSFRTSVTDWLEQVLPADIYLRVPVSGANAGIKPDRIDKARELPGVRQVRGLRMVQTYLKDHDATISLMAQRINKSDPTQSIPVTGSVLSQPEQDTRCVAIYASEPAAKRFGLVVGERVSLSLTLAPQTQLPCFQIIAIWRDYARQQGSLTIDLRDYQRLTGDSSISNLAISVKSDTSDDVVIPRLREFFDDMPGVMMRSATDIRELSLKIFDRSFAVTYALEAVALLVGLFGIVTTYAGEALSRSREFGMLRHLGVTRSQVVRIFAYEALASIAIGVIWGGLIGAAIAQVLIHWVNPQSFHWTMQTHWPVLMLALSAALIVCLGVLAAVIASRKTGSAAPIAAVRADW